MFPHLPLHQMTPEKMVEVSRLMSRCHGVTNELSEYCCEIKLISLSNDPSMRPEMSERC